MPLPKPKNDESHDEFIERCMADPVMVDEYEEDDQRLAVCQSQWDKDKTGDAAMPATIERRFVPEAVSLAKVETREDGTKHIVGYGAVYYDGTPETEFPLWDNMVERILPGAFDRAAREDDVRGLFNHDANMLLGRTPAGTMSLSVDERGLHYDIVAPDTQAGRDVIISVERGDLTGSSFSFMVQEQVWRMIDEVDIREIVAVQLFDTGPVTFPAYEGTTTGVRAESDAAEARKACDAWKKGVAARMGHIQRQARLREIESQT